MEINGSFYSLQRPDSYRRWREQVPSGFVFAVKGGRFITHMKRLRDVEVPLANFFASGVLALGPTLGPVLWQLPERLAFDEALVGDFLAMLPRTTVGRGGARVAARRQGPRRPGTHHRRGRRSAPARAGVPASVVRLRRGVRRCCGKHDVATVVADSAGRWPRVFEVTSDLVYVRLHGDRELYASGYSARSLDEWAARCRDWMADGRDVHVYFDNDAKGHAPHDAVALQERLA